MSEERKNVFPSSHHSISPYDLSYPAELFSGSINANFSKAQDAAERIYEHVTRNLPLTSQIQQAMKQGCRYVVDISDKTIQDIDNGIVKLTQENGKTYAQLKTNGRYGSKLPIKKDVFRKGIDPVQIANALQMQAFQEQIENVATQLNLIGSNVKEVLQGQQNDRIGLYYSGVSLFLESQYVSDKTLKQNLQAQALRALAEATFQLRTTMQSDIHYLECKEYESAKGKRKELIIEHMNSINRAFGFIHQSTMLRAGIYCNIGESTAMTRVLDEYSDFIKTDLAPKIDLLSQYDLNDNGLQSGLWKSRAKLNLDTSKLVKMLDNSPQELYLMVEPEVTECEKN